jgi:hypothetical protein
MGDGKSTGAAKRSHRQIPGTQKQKARQKAEPLALGGIEEKILNIYFSSSTHLQDSEIQS